LKKAAELSPQNYDYISLAAYFEWFNATMQAKANHSNYNPDSLPDTTRRSIHDAMTQLETLSQSSDKKLAAGALENLGVLNIFFGNSQAATANLRQAVSLDPTREESWDMCLPRL
jgi:Flp pilus assembly protein TadD